MVYWFSKAPRSGEKGAVRRDPCTIESAQRHTGKRKPKETQQKVPKQMQTKWRKQKTIAPEQNKATPVAAQG